MLNAHGCRIDARALMRCLRWNRIENVRSRPDPIREKIYEQSIFKLTEYNAIFILANYADVFSVIRIGKGRQATAILCPTY